MEQLDLMCWFREGLLPEIRTGCMKPTTGQREFASLQELLTHALLHEEFLHETSKHATAPKLAAIHTTGRHSGTYQRRTSDFHQGHSGSAKRPAESNTWHHVGGRPNKAYKGTAKHQQRQRQQQPQQGRRQGNQAGRHIEGLGAVSAAMIDAFEQERARRRDHQPRGLCQNCGNMDCRIRDCPHPRTMHGLYMDATHGPNAPGKQP
jgi:hypothetical protein